MKTFKTLAFAFLLISIVSCSSTAKLPSEETAATKMPIVQAAEEAKPTTTEEQAQAEAPKGEGSAFRGEVSLYGHTLIYEAYVGKATITYPSFITKPDIDSFFGIIAEKYGPYLEGVSYSVIGDGKLEITYPESVSIEDGKAALSLLPSEIESYVSSMAENENQEAKQEATPGESPEKEEAVAAPEAKPEPKAEPESKAPLIETAKVETASPEATTEETSENGTMIKTNLITGALVLLIVICLGAVAIIIRKKN